MAQADNWEEADWLDAVRCVTTVKRNTVLTQQVGRSGLGLGLETGERPWYRKLG